MVRSHSQTLDEIQILNAGTGFDTVGLGYTNTTGPTLQHQIVSEIVSDSWWFGILGLGFQPTNFTDYANPQPSFADSLYANGLMSSMSWSYTAGAYYRLKGVFGSLIFGGYDESRFTPNNVIFTMAPDNLRDLVVTIRSITSNSSSGVLEFMSTPQFAFIDSSVPELWLPKEVCDAFAQAFNLTFDSPTGLYLVGPSAHSSLLILNPTIKITLANQKSGGSTASIELPYAAFDLRIAPPILANRTSYYFPIRQGKDETQYTLGRTFLQEAYVTAHYESRTFNVSQCVFTDPLQAKIIALPLVLYTTPAPNPSANTTPPTNSSSSQMSLSKGAIAGISTGVLALLVVILYGIIMIHRRRIHAAAARREFSDMETHGQNPSQIYVDEMATTGQAEMDGHDAKFEKFGNPIMIPQELEGVPVSSRAPVVEVGEREGGLSAVSEDTDDDMEIQRQGKDYVVSPKSAGTGSMSSKFESANGRRTTDIPMRPNIVVSSPGTSLGGNPASPGRESKFEEHL